MFGGLRDAKQLVQQGLADEARGHLRHRLRDHFLQECGVEALVNAFGTDDLYTLTEDDTKLIATAKVAGANRNADKWKIYPGTSGFTFASTLATKGEDTVIGSVLLGFVKRESCKDSFKAGDIVNVVMKGGIQLKAGEAIDSFSALYVETNGNTVVDTAGSNVNANAISLTSAANGGLFDALIG